MPGAGPTVQQPWDRGPPPAPPDPLVLVAWFEEADRARIVECIGPTDATVSWSVVANVDWEAESRAGFTPITVGSFTVAPPWAASPGDLVIEPGIGFGTGHHATTRQVLCVLSELTRAHDTVLDVGCGSGILTLAATRLGMTAHGVDIDPDAVASARDHASINQLAATFDTTPIRELQHAYDLVLANVHAEALQALAFDLQRLTRCTLVVAGVLQAKEHAVLRALSDLRVRRRRQEAEWVCLELER